MRCAGVEEQRGVCVAGGDETQLGGLGCWWELVRAQQKGGGRAGWPGEGGTSVPLVVAAPPQGGRLIALKLQCRPKSESTKLMSAWGGV